MNNLDKYKNELKIEYPCVWNYKLIGKEADALRDAVEEVVNKENFLLSLSNKSTKGNFTSFNLAVKVEDEAHRLDVYQRLKNLTEIAIIL
ncbi:MAG: DUF493 domain-containing protein [Calditrichaeota bacterium]|nr:MAG: DUF493 domain-containing protein [Calditrichota bacterium]